ncbi:hypothetical protein IGI04_019400 [Brassica rapa subsp. trilocularis]|uniref:Aspartic peptidase DDI1-type domain-containing protein n=1 Tax=Brassica rapa subsp. trilocularis TaxID=1813537 RepID=A0ABQ7MI50_BRACM|nr:hypothetical protein IGI04_019400 [Brassica rapa subsp. trilocularis]
MDGITKRILRMPIEKPFDEAYFTHRLWMFFRETKITEDDIRIMFHQVREKMRHIITLSKKSDPGKFAIPCVLKGIEFPHSMCDTGASVSILPRIMADHLGLTIEPSKESFTFVDLSEKRSGGIIRDLEVQIGNALVPVDFHVLDIKLNWNSSLLLGRSFLATVGAVCDMNKNKLCLTLIDPNIHYDPIRPKRKNINSMDYGKNLASLAHAIVEQSTNQITKQIDTIITSPNEEHTEEYDEDYWKERAIEMSLHDEIFETHKFINTFPTSFDEVHSTSVDTHPRPAKQPLTSIDTHIGTSIDIRAAAKIQEQENIPSPTRNPDGNARAIDGRILQVSKEDIADILQVANGPDNLFSQQCGTPDVIQTDPSKHVGVSATEINPDLSCQPKGQASIDGTTQTSIDRITPPSTDKDDPTSIDRRYEFGYRAFDMYEARKFTWERRDEYGVYRDECGHARGVAGEMIPVTKDDIKKLLERASLFEESHICLSEQATSFTLTRLAPELYTKDEINEMVTSICGAQEKLGEELKSLSLRQQLEKEATTSTLIDAPHEPSIDVSLPTAQIPAEPQYSAEHKDEWEVTYINTRINDVYYPLNNNVDWLSTKIELLQQDLDTIRKKDQQPATSIDVCTITSIKAKISAMDDRLQTYEDMHDRFVSPVMICLSKLSSQILHAQRDIDKITTQIFLQANSSSIDRLRGPWIDGKNHVELLPYTAAEVDKITSKIYTAIDTTEERLDKRCDDIYFPFDNRIGRLDSHAKWLQKEVKAIQRRLTAQHQISASIDRKRAKSLDGKSPRSTDEHLIASIDAESTPAGEQLIHKRIESMHEELTELSAYAYDNIGWHQVSIDNVQDRLQNISNVLKKMDDK